MKEKPHRALLTGLLAASHAYGPPAFLPSSGPPARGDNVHICLASPTPVISEGNVPQMPTAQSDLDSSSAEVSSSFAI